MPRFTRTALASAVALSVTATAALAQESEQLDNIVVSASGFEQALVDAPASISVVSREELERKRITSVADALRDVEGVDVGGAVGKTGGSNISIRGMPSDYTLILIDGRRQNAAGSVTPNGFGETSTSFFPPVSSIERIEVIRGPMSTLYGSDAMGGVINIITRRVDREWVVSVGIENTFNEDRDFGDRREINLYTSGPLIQDTLGIQVRGRLYERDASELTYTDGNGNPIDVSQRGPSPVEGDTYNLGGKLTWTPNADHDLWVDGEVNRQRYNNDECQLGTLDGRTRSCAPDPGVANGYADELRFERQQVAIGHTGRFASGTLESSLMRNTTETKGRTIPGENGVAYDGFPGIVGGAPRELETTNTVLDSKYIMPLGDHMTTVGLQWWDAKLDDGLANETFEQTTWSLFAEDEWMLRDDLALTLGGRYDHHDAFGSQFSPRSYLVWNTTPNWTLKGGVSRGYKTPSLNDLHAGINGVTGQGTILTIGNPNLEPETSTSSEISAHYDSQAGFTASATLFYNEFDDKIASGNDIVVENDPLVPDGVYSQDVNIDEAVTQGVELATSYQFTPDWRLSANYTYTDSEQKSGNNRGEPLTDTPEHAFNATLRWQATPQLDTWLSAEYRSERYRNRESVRGAPSFDDLGDFKAYSLFHLGGSYAFTEQFNVSATIYNVFDKDFVDYRAYGDGTSFGNVYANSEEGRRLWLSARYEF
ncbi:TonB-dependent receptor domain-containing protein [Halomonas sp. TD01]|uniref:TonB-dependent receptor domain-containing protein n=1 Tax=Halomonas sp. TD01 TaxID=999141 RepID=UPI000214F108|nr:TonB-dependent receptor [Halomonas sp. TD01]EGP21533.1 putative outer membrane receptor [Halomonas sp. TD01]CAH1043618.1 TonB-dependent receptor; Outer membrane receptor for ferrienterochelin and colicins [Halomonas sp. TD01]